MSDNAVRLPDFRNLGVILRLLVVAELANFGALLAYSPQGVGAVWDVASWGMLFEISLLVVLLFLFLLSPLLSRLPYRRGVWMVIGFAAGVSAALDFGLKTWVGPLPTEGPLKAALLAALVGGLILAYFNWRQRVLLPAVGESRLMALQARIRPHFLFNSINAAISVVRQDPKRAEEVLLDMSDLFRVVLAEPRALVPLGKEIEVARAYLDIEHLRLGERLRVRWDCAGVPLDAQVPVLMLQPLLENAVWHGIEPSDQDGEIAVRIHRAGKTLHIEVSNPVPTSSRSSPGGNRIALANIEERLALHFDAEAKLVAAETDGQFVVRLWIPLKQEGGAVLPRPDALELQP